MNEYAPRYVYWELSNFCNLRCKHCFAEANSDRSSIANQLQIQRKLEEMLSYGNFAVRFGGGEPLLVPYLIDLLEFCSRKNIKVDITTNGTLITDIVIERFLIAGLRELTISIDGLETTHDLIRGYGSFQRVLAAIKKVLVHNGITLSVAFTVNALNYTQIEDYVKEMVTIGVKKFYFFRYCDNSNSNYLHLSQEALESASKSIYHVSQMYREIRFVHEEFSFYTKQWNDEKTFCEGCNFLKGVMSIDYTGNVVVCAAINKVLGNIYHDKLDKIYHQIRAEQKAMCYIPTVCETCHYQTVCHGGCKGYSYHADGTYRNRDTFCYAET